MFIHVSERLLFPCFCLQERQYFLTVNLLDKDRSDPDTIDLEAPRLAQYMHEAWKKHQNTVYWVDIKFAQKKGLKFYQTRSNAIILYQTLPASCIPKAVRMETGEIIYEKVYESPRPPPKISLRNDWMKELGSEVADERFGFRSCSTTRRRSCANHDRTVKPVVCPQEGVHQTRFSRGSTNFNVEDETNPERTGRPVVCSQSDRSMLNEVDIDFRMLGLPHSVVKQADNYHVRELVKKIENHPHRQSLQRDLQQNNAYNPFGEKSKKTIKDMGNVELFELLNAKSAYCIGV